MGDTNRIYQALTSHPWAITEDYLRLMVEIAARKEVDVAAVEERLGRKLDNTRTVTERGGVAIIPITGPIFRYANLFSEISGGTSVQVLAKDLRAALDSPDVRAILLNIDSPGGDANGINEFAAMVYAARGKKPITAYIGGMGCSAAYWVASAADSIICDATALVGSIGVIASMPAGDDPSEVIFISSQSPRKRESPTTEEGRASIQSTIDAMADVFVGRVAEYRGVSTDTVLSDFGQGGIFVGQHAVTAGLADRLGSFEATLAGMSGGRGEQAAQATHTPTSMPAAQIAALGIPITTVASAFSTRPITSLSFPTPSAAGGLRADTQPIVQQETPIMSEETIQRPELPSDAGEQALTQALAGMDEQMTARQLEMLQTQWTALEQRANARAEERFNRWQAEQKQRQDVSTYVQHVISATLNRPYALPVEATALESFLLSLNADQRTGAQTLFNRILDAGLVSFEEIGSAAEGGDGPSAKERFDAAVLAKVGTGMTRLAAMEAVGKEQPKLYEEYQAEGLTPKATKKGAR